MYQDVKDRYRLKEQDPILLYGYPKYVTFTTHGPVKFPVSSPAYLAIHAACARVTYLSGANQRLDKFNEDLG